MNGAFLGPQFDTADITRALDALKAEYKVLPDDELFPILAELLECGNIIGWFQGRMEFGPRALGGRSSVGDPRNPRMQSAMNLKIKNRESFRPLAPSVRFERAGEYFELDRSSPYMLLVAEVRDDRRIRLTDEQQRLAGVNRLNIPRSTVPAITHVDYSARIQTVRHETNPRYYELISEFEKRTGCPVLVNTSFSVRGEPIVCTPEDAYRCFMRTKMDYLLLENVLLSKNKQLPNADDESWTEGFELD